MKHVMIDLETMGNKPNAPIIAIGAVFFDMTTGEMGTEFYKEINLESSVGIGCEMDPSTVLWWLKQSDAARAKFAKNDKAEHVLTSLIEFTEFMGKGAKPWGNGAGFDLGILANSYRHLGMEPPWQFWNERDVRTIVELDTKNHKNMKFTGIPHYALDDAKHQVKYVSAIIRDMV
jgi:DNA polymerase III epsilon subunit-like protein